MTDRKTVKFKTLLPAGTIASSEFLVHVNRHPDHNPDCDICRQFYSYSMNALTLLDTVCIFVTGPKDLSQEQSINKLTKVHLDEVTVQGILEWFKETFHDTLESGGVQELIAYDPDSLEELGRVEIEE